MTASLGVERTSPVREHLGQSMPHPFGDRRVDIDQ
jgi:hypothetical protein